MQTHPPLHPQVIKKNIQHAFICDAAAIRLLMASNSQVGKIVVVVALTLFLYYFFWVSILPFMLIDEGNIIHSLFPPLEYAFIFPAVFGVIFLGGASIYTLYHIWDHIWERKTI